VADPDCQQAAVEAARALEVERPVLYEVVLQSYLFLGFPRMLQAAQDLQSVWPATEGGESQLRPVSAAEGERWFDRGMKLYGRVYGSNSRLLQRRVEKMAPEIFRWMVIEGYGKVLSREGLQSIDRELAVVACLIIENHAPQLHSHMRGALNVGCSEHLLATVVEDLGEPAGPGYITARGILERLKATE
jgi:4-carboxymuconolactone decarboxylase